MVSLGRVREATRCLVSPGLASETPAVKARLLTKFPAQSRLRPYMPPSFLFVKGLARGPTEFEGIFSVICWDNDLMKNLLLNSFEIWCSCWPMARRRNISAPSSGAVDLWGVGKKDGSGNLISLEADARPIVLGLTWRKVVFKATFSLDRSRTQERLGDT